MRRCKGVWLNRKWGSRVDRGSTAFYHSCWSSPSLVQETPTRGIVDQQLPQGRSNIDVSSSDALRMVAAPLVSGTRFEGKINTHFELVPGHLNMYVLEADPNHRFGFPCANRRGSKKAMGSIKVQEGTPTEEEIAGSDFVAQSSIGRCVFGFRAWRALSLPAIAFASRKCLPL